VLFLCFSPLIFAYGMTGNSASTVGPTYPIIEEDLLAVITKRLEALQQQGKLQELTSKWQQQVVQQADRPRPVISITKATENRNYTVDMSITLRHAIYDNHGQMLYPAGVRINPLDTISLSNTLLFIDGDDKQQVNWAKEVDKAKQGKTKLILVSGSLKAINQQWNPDGNNKVVYFDQGGSLTRKFKIEHVPAQVNQQGKRLQVMEVKLP
jgi:conjugal transfer pilus assembly protein TraW